MLVFQMHKNHTLPGPKHMCLAVAWQLLGDFRGFVSTYPCLRLKNAASQFCPSTVLTCDKVVTLTKKSYQFVLSLQGHREKSKSRTTGQKVVTPHCPPRKVCAPKAHPLFSQDTAVLRLSGPWYDFSTFLAVPAGTTQIGTFVSTMLRL